MRHAIVAIALICAASSAQAAATGTLTKTFDGNAAQTIALGGESLMVLLVSINYTSGHADSLVITDHLPAGMVVAPAEDQPQLPSTCTAANSTFSATPGSHLVSYSWYDYDHSRPAFACQLRIKVKAVQAGAWTNTASATSASDHGGGVGVTVSGSATLTVVGPPTLARSLSGFVPGTTDGTSWAMPGQVLTAHYALANPDSASTLTGVGFTETLPPGVASGAGAILGNTCADGAGSTDTATASSGSIVLSGVQLAAGASCALDVQIVANDPGTYTLSTAAASNEGGAGEVVATTFQAFTAPASQLSFTHPASGSIEIGGNATLVLALTSTTTVDVDGVGFSAVLPTGLSAADGTAGQCGGVTTTSAGTLALSGANVPAGGSCTVAFDVVGVHAGYQYVGGTVTTHGAVVHDDFGAGLSVNALATATTLTTPCMTTYVDVLPPQPFTVSAAVTGVNDPGGSVTFTDSVAGILCGGTVALDAGAATCTTTALAAGEHSLSAAYVPDADHGASSSLPLAVRVLDATDAIYRNGYETDADNCPVE